jgi:hypothetical protein
VTTAPGTGTAHERPPGIALIVIFLIVDAAVGIADVAFDLQLTSRAVWLAGLAEWVPVFLVGVALVELVAAVGLWRGSRPAWVVVMLLVGVGLVFGLYLRWVDEPNYPRLALNVVMAFYLTQGAVRAYVMATRSARPQRE